MLGVALVVLGVVAVLGVLAAPWLADLLTSGVTDPADRRASRRRSPPSCCGSSSPRSCCTRWARSPPPCCNAQRVFVLPAAAPIANTVVMVAFLACFRVVAGPDPGLDLTDWRDPAARPRPARSVWPRSSRCPPSPCGRGGSGSAPVWRTATRRCAACSGSAPGRPSSTPASALLLGAAIVVGGAVEGAVVAYQVGWFLFLAPYGVIAQPIQTTILPELATAARRPVPVHPIAALGRWRRPPPCSFP